MKKVFEAIRSLIAATLLICCLLNLWLALGVFALLCVSALVQWVLRLGDNR